MLLTVKVKIQPRMSSGVMSNSVAMIAFNLTLSSVVGDALAVKSTYTLSREVHRPVGAGVPVGLKVGAGIGSSDGSRIGSCVGAGAGSCVGAEVGTFVGVADGALVGSSDGSRVGDGDGT